MFGLLTLQIIFCFTRLFWSKGSPTRQETYNVDPVIITFEWKHLLVAFFWLIKSLSTCQTIWHWNAYESYRTGVSLSCQRSKLFITNTSVYIGWREKCHVTIILAKSSHSGEFSWLSWTAIVPMVDIWQDQLSRVLCHDKIFHEPFSIYANTYKRLMFLTSQIKRKVSEFCRLKWIQQVWFEEIQRLQYLIWQKNTSSYWIKKR